MPDDIRQSLELNAKQVLDELERLKTSFTSYNDRLSTTANRLDSVTDSAKRTLSTLRDLRTEARLVERAMGAIGVGTKSLGSLTNGKGVTGIADASKTFDQFFVNAQRAQAVSRQTGESVSDAFERIHTATQSKFVPASKQVQKGTESMWLSWQTFARVVQTQLFVRGMNAVRDAFTESASAAMEFSSNVSNIRAINPERSFGEIAASVRVMSDEFNQSLETVSKAQLEVISDQFSDTADMVNILTAANKLAKATGEDLVPTAQLLTGALNAYGESADMAEVRAAQFFTTIDLGRLKAGELATALGRVQSIGNSAGVAMEELDAALAAITIGGVKSNEAATQLRGVLVGFLKPTEEMQKALAKLGFESGEVAIKTLGLHGALEALIGTTDGSATSIAALFQNQRALAGVLRLVGSGAEAYAASLKTIYASEQKLLDSKLGERMETDAERLTKATNQLKNFWTAEFGADVVEKLNTVIQLVGGGDGMVGAFRHLTSTLPLAAAAMGGLALATSTWSKVSATGVRNFVRGIDLSITKVGALRNAIGLITLYELGTGLVNQVGNILVDYATGPIKASREAMERWFEEGTQQMSTMTRLKQRQVEEMVRAAREYVAESNVTYLRDQKNFEASVSGQEQAAKRAFDRIMQHRQRLQGQLLSLSEDAAKKAAESIPKSIEVLQRKIDDRKSQTWLDKTYAKKDQFAPLEARMLKELDIAQKLQATAKDEAQEKLAAEAWSRVEAFRQQAAEAAKLSGSEDAIRRSSLHQDQIDKRRIESLQKQAAMQRVLAALLETRSIQAETHTAQLEAMRATIESQLETTVKTSEGGYRQKTSDELKRDIGLAEDSIAQFQAMYTKYSQEDFATPFAGDSRAFAEMRRDAARVLASYDIQTLSVTPSAIGKLQADLQASFRDMVFELPAVVRVYEILGLDPTSTDPNTALDLAQKQLSEFDAAQQKYVQGSRAMRSANDQFGKSLKGAYGLLPKGADWHGVDEFLRKLSQMRFDTDLTQEELAAFGPDSPDMKAMEAGVKEVFGFWSQMSPGRHFGMQGKVQREQFNEEVKAAISAIQQRAKAQELLKDAGPMTQERANENAELRKGFLELENKRQSQININENVKWELNAQGNIVGRLKTQNELLKERATLLHDAAKGPTKGMAFGGYFAEGGFPRGFDTIPAMLSPGEFVVNAQSARRFASQLVAMNAGIQPAYRNDGGSVTNVGDIHVNVNGGGTSRQTAREIALELKREIRRGTVRL